MIEFILWMMFLWVSASFCMAFLTFLIEIDKKDGARENGREMGEFFIWLLLAPIKVSYWVLVRFKFTPTFIRGLLAFTCGFLEGVFKRRKYD